jgi:hypothetical protein
MIGEDLELRFQVLPFFLFQIKERKRMAKTNTEAKNAVDHRAQSEVVSRPLPYDPVVEAIRILARRGRQLREAEERAAQAAASRAGDELPVDTHGNLD